jgi:hypothetical protein
LGLRKFDVEMKVALHRFLLGESDELLERLSLKLLDSKAARVKAAEVELALEVLERFWRRETQRLAAVLTKLSYSEYPVAQHLRDILFLAGKSGNLP